MIIMGVEVTARVSVPSSSGHVFQPSNTGSPASRGLGFSPLFIGARVPALWPAFFCCFSSQRFSPLFIGARVPAAAYYVAGGWSSAFQSPLHRGTCSSLQQARLGQIAGSRFSPLFIGARVPAEILVAVGIIAAIVSVPSSSGHVFQRRERFASACPASPFQSPLHRGTCSSYLACLDPRTNGSVSVPSSSGHVFQPGWRGALFNLYLRLVSVPSSSGHVFQQATF